MAQDFNPAIFQAALLEVAEATKAATTAVQAMQAAQQQQPASPQVQPAAVTSSPTGSPGGATDWSKLVNKPPLLDGKTVEDEIRMFRDWLWMLTQFLNTIDAGFETEVQAIVDSPAAPLDMSTASAETRQRGAKLYGLLASLCRNRSLNIIRSVKQGDGFEGLRQLILNLRPSTNTRGLALMGALTSWPSFNIGQLLQPQLLKLEEALEEARRAGSNIPDQLQQAILLKCVSRQLRTYLNLAVQDATTFKELREQVLRWDRSQQKWSNLIFDESSGATPMEVDRVYADGRHWNVGGKKGDKGKGKNAFSSKGNSKGKVKGKTKTKDGKGQKGKQKSEMQSRGSGKQSVSGKGKSGKTDVQCHKCGKYGHFARDCWGTSVRQVQSESSNNVQPVQQTSVPAGSPASSTSSQLPVAPQQGRVARIQFADDHGSDVSKHDELIFDLRSPCSASSCMEGNVKTMQFYIGDEPNDAECDVETCMAVRTMLESVDDVTQMHNILLDSGADASVFPVSMAELGSPCNNVHTVLRDAQGQPIPLHGCRDVELHFMDMKGRSVVPRETVALSDRITQPILCFGHLLENGWSVNGIEQTLTHGSGISIPIELQNKSMLLRGWVRMIKDEPQVLEPFSIRAVRAEIFNELSGMRVV